jgi:hypothetical protein
VTVDATRKPIAAFSLGILASLASRRSGVSPLPESDPATFGGLLVGGGQWILGCYCGCEAVRSEDAA